jgi:hypothetical protein
MRTLVAVRIQLHLALQSITVLPQCISSTIISGGISLLQLYGAITYPVAAAMGGQVIVNAAKLHHVQETIGGRCTRVDAANIDHLARNFFGLVVQDVGELVIPNATGVC